jgi:hypothetical protein
MIFSFFGYEDAVTECHRREGLCQLGSQPLAWRGL